MAIIREKYAAWKDSGASSKKISKEGLEASIREHVLNEGYDTPWKLWQHYKVHHSGVNKADDVTVDDETYSIYFEEDSTQNNADDRIVYCRESDGKRFRNKLRTFNNTFSKVIKKIQHTD